MTEQAGVAQNEPMHPAKPRQARLARGAYHWGRDDWPKVLLDRAERLRAVELADQSQRRVVRSVRRLKEPLHPAQRHAAQVCDRLGIADERMPLAVQCAQPVAIDQAAESALALALLIVDDAPLHIERRLVEAGERERHSLALQPEHCIERGSGDLRVVLGRLEL